MSAGRAFFDTNILVYMQGGEDSAKTARANELFSAHLTAQTILLSTQVVQEFYVVTSRKLPGIPQDKLHELIVDLLELPLVCLDKFHILAALGNEAKYQISFWDGLIVAAAEAGGARILYTEDLNHGQKYGTVEARNPFR